MLKTTSVIRQITHNTVGGNIYTFIFTLGNSKRESMSMRRSQFCECVNVQYFLRTEGLGIVMPNWSRLGLIFHTGKNLLCQYIFFPILS